MKKFIIGSLVGAVLLFAWQSLSWTVFHFHEKAYQYTSSQDTLLSQIGNNLKEEGQYIVPTLPAGSDYKSMQEFDKNMQGKPWAVVAYHKAYKSDMVMQVARGFLVCLFCVMMCCVIIGRLGSKRFGSIFATTLYLGIICFLFVWYNGHIWMYTGWEVLKPELLDDLVGWGLTGLWLGWWYSRK
jgi:lipopolysaccharide export LptBFGC system permease protein LptF